MNDDPFAAHTCERKLISSGEVSYARRHRRIDEKIVGAIVRCDDLDLFYAVWVPDTRSDVLNHREAMRAKLRSVWASCDNKAFEYRWEDASRSVHFLKAHHTIHCEVINSHHAISLARMAMRASLRSVDA